MATRPSERWPLPELPPSPPADPGTVPIDLLPPGPFPPWGPARRGNSLDLGALLRDQLLSRRTLWGPVRKLLQARLAHALEGQQWARAAELLTLWLDTWPVGAAVDPALSAWLARPAAADLAVLARAAELGCAGLGWQPQPGTPWPLPSAAWIREQVEGRPVHLRTRGEDDGRQRVCEALGVEPGPEEVDLHLPTVLDLPGEALIARRGELASALVRGELGAVRLTTPLPPVAAARLALGELRLEGPHQRAFEEWGRAGLRVEGFATWEEQLQVAPSGEDGPLLQATADALLAPGTPASIRRGELSDTGWLVWDAPFRPVPVLPVAVACLRALDGERDAAAVAAEGRGPLDQVRAVLSELVQLGAATAC